MDRFFGQEALPWRGSRKGFTPTTDVVETDKAFEVTVDLPGMKPEELAIELKNGQLWINGEKKEEKEEKGKTYHRMERYYGSFQRVVPLPTAVDEEKIAADYKQGVLRVTLPKSEAVQPRHIEVKT